MQGNAKFALCYRFKSPSSEVKQSEERTFGFLKYHCRALIMFAKTNNNNNKKNVILIIWLYNKKLQFVQQTYLGQTLWVVFMLIISLIYYNNVFMSKERNLRSQLANFLWQPLNCELWGITQLSNSKNTTLYCYIVFQLQIEPPREPVHSIIFLSVFIFIRTFGIYYLNKIKFGVQYSGKHIVNNFFFFSSSSLVRQRREMSSYNWSETKPFKSEAHKFKDVFISYRRKLERFILSTKNDYWKN